MTEKMPRTPFSTPLSGSAKLTEMRLRNIFSGPKKRPPALFLALMFSVCIFCGNLVSCQVSEKEQELPPPDLSLAPVDWAALPLIDPAYTLEENGNTLIEGIGDVYVEWHRTSTGNYLYFAGDPAFCCPSLAGRTAEGTAKWQDEQDEQDDTWGPVAVDLTVNDDRLEDGTVAGYQLHFVAGWDSQTVSESSFTSEVGDGDLELSEKDMLHAAWALAKLMSGAEWSVTADVTVFPQHPDLNRNGTPEEIRLIVPDTWGSGQRVEIWEDGRRLLAETGAEQHVGWNALFLCTLDGKDYLLRYDPYMGQGLAGYHYSLFTLEGGKEYAAKANELYFEVNFGMPTPDGGVVDPDEIFDPDEIADFMEEINELLSHSVQLLNTDQELLRTFEREGRLVDTLLFLHDEIFTPDPEKSLRENLWDYRNAWVRWVSER